MGLGGQASRLGPEAESVNDKAERIEQVRSRSFRRYPEYKDSGVDWLGEIPVHWNAKRMKFVAPTRITKLDIKPDNAVYVGLEHIESWTGRLLLETQPEGVDSVVSSFVRGDVLFGKLRPYLAKAARPDVDGVCSSEILPLRPTPGCFQSYMMYCLLNAPYIHWLDSMTYGTKMPRVSPDQVRSSHAPLPPEGEQSVIAAFLDRETAKIDGLVARKERLIELLQEKRTALITRAVTRGLDPNVPMKDSGVRWLGKIPKRWKLKRVKQAAEILRGKFTHRPRNDPSLYDGRYPFIQTGDVARSQKVIVRYRQTLNEQGLGVSKLFPSGTLVMTIAANIGDVAVLDFTACFPDSIVGFVPRDGVHRDFLYYVFLGMKPELLREAPVNTQGNLNVERIGSHGTQIPLPGVMEQSAIAAFLDRETAKIDSLIAKIRQAIDHLKEFRTALISAAVTGKIDVRGEAS